MCGGIEGLQIRGPWRKTMDKGDCYRLVVKEGMKLNEVFATKKQALKYLLKLATKVIKLLEERSVNEY